VRSDSQLTLLYTINCVLIYFLSPDYARLLDTPLARLTLWDLLSVAWGVFLVLNVGFWVIICLYVLFGNFFALFDRAAWREPPPSPLRPPPLPPREAIGSVRSLLTFPVR
jgi:hypothetical protein